MISRCGTRYRFPLGSILFIYSISKLSYASSDVSSGTLSLSSLIIQVGFAGLGLLTLYVIYLTVPFLIKALKESSEAAKKAAAHSPEEKGDISFSTASWLSGIFAFLTTGILFVVFFYVMAGIDMSSTIGMGRFIIQMGFVGFCLLALYLLILALSPLFKGKAKTTAPVPTVVAADIPLNPELTRRSFLSLLGWAWVAFTAATMGALSTMLRFAFPNVTFEPPQKFKVGFPSEFPMGVDNRFKDQYRVWIVREDKGFYALSTICTHLGCTPNWLSAEEKFKCPCHGSGFYASGVNFEGPAPRPLERFMIVLSDDGQIEVDQSKVYQQEKGDWGKAGSFLEYIG